MSHTNFLGITVEGDITSAETRAAQKPLSEFEPIIRAVLDDETIVEFGWRQYTPYFNDGEPCTFGAHGVWVRTTSDPKSGDEDGEEIEDGLDVEYGHPSLGEIEWDWTGDAIPRERVFKSYEGPDQERLMRCLALNDAIGGGSFDGVLIEAFGDHANVKVSRTGITVEFYEHD